MNIRKKENGVTLIALAVTIIVMLILAGVAIATLTGEDSITSNAHKAKIEQEKSKFEEDARLIYSEKYIEKSGTGENITFKDLKQGLEDKGYKIFKKIFNEVNGEKNILLDQEVIALEVGKRKYLSVKGENYVEIESKYYKIMINNGEVKLSTESYNIKNELESDISVVSNNSNLVAQIEGDKILLEDKGGEYANYTITISCGTYSKNYNIAVVKKPPESRVEDYTISIKTDYGKIDVIWLDNNNNVIEEPNAPILTANGESMIPVIWNAKNNIETTNANDGNWYNYNTNKWANAKTANDSYFVWIPRYAYRIVYYEDTTYSKITGFWDGLGFWKADTGESRGEIDEGIKTVEYNGDSYIVHPAFETDLESGGWSSELSGIWVSKFEISQDGEELKSTYGVKSIRNQTIGEQYTTARNGIYGFNGSQDEDGHTSYMNSHMIKNSEWGAIAYLTESRYGRAGNNIEKSTTDSYTGGGIDKTYIDKVQQTTTGNVYGIYDLVGGALERMACFNSLDKNDYLTQNGWSSATGLTINSKSTKYATKYNNIISSSEWDAKYELTTVFRYGKIGDATKEVRKKDYTTSWHGERMPILYYDKPFLERGNETEWGVAGIFAIIAVDGIADENYTLRTILCP